MWETIIYSVLAIVIYEWLIGPAIRKDTEDRIKRRAWEK